MKWFFIIIGSIIAVVGLLQGGKLLPYLCELTDYGKGYFFGAILMFLIGIALIIIGIKSKNKLNK